MSNRPETGPMKFGSDWTGVFIRGDNAVYFGMLLKEFLEGDSNPIAVRVLKGLAATLTGASEIPEFRQSKEEPEVQKMKDFKECKG